MPKILKIIAIGSGLCLLTFVAFLISFGGDNTISLSQKITGSPSLISPSIQLPNLTEKLTDQLAKEIVASNPDGPSPDGVGIIIPDPDELVAKTLRDQLAGFDPADLRPFITEKEIVIKKSATDQDRVDYFKLVPTIFAKRFSEQHIADLKNPRPEEFSAVSKAYKDTMAELASVPIPEDLTDIHIHTLEMLGIQSSSFELLSKFKEDPLKALLAAQLQESIAQEASELRQEMVSYIEEHNLIF